MDAHRVINQPKKVGNKIKWWYSYLVASLSSVQSWSSFMGAHVCEVSLDISGLLSLHRWERWPMLTCVRHVHVVVKAFISGKLEPTNGQRPLHAVKTWMRSNEGLNLRGKRSSRSSTLGATLRNQIWTARLSSIFPSLRGVRPDSDAVLFMSRT